MNSPSKTPGRSERAKICELLQNSFEPPTSCIIDGVQYISGYTLGKGNIEIINQQLPEVTFILEEKYLTIKLKNIIKTAGRNLKEIAMEIYDKKPQELFEISKNF